MGLFPYLIERVLIESVFLFQGEKAKEVGKPCKELSKIFYCILMAHSKWNLTFEECHGLAFATRRAISVGILWHGSFFYFVTRISHLFERIFHFL
jgi:hypothetical protein